MTDVSTTCAESQKGLVAKNEKLRLVGPCRVVKMAA